MIFPFDSDLPPGMLKKSDGATTYFTRDLATLKFRKEKWDPDLIVYEVGAEQKLHFRQVFQAADMLGWFEKEQLIHIPHGLIRLREGKMSTRKGNVIKLEEVLSEAIERAKKFNSDPELAKKVGIGAVKYNDLKHAPSRGYTFDWDEMLTLEGDSGPYLQYTYARAQSVLKKTGSDSAKFIRDFQLKTDYQPNSEELAILQQIYRTPEVLEEAAFEFAPHKICTFLHQLTQAYNSFYNKHNILKSNDDCRQLRIALTQATAVTIKYCLNILGIKAPAEM